MSLTFGDLKHGDIFRWDAYPDSICMKIKKCSYVDAKVVGRGREMFMYIFTAEGAVIGELYAQYTDLGVVLVRVEDL